MMITELTYDDAVVLDLQPPNIDDGALRLRVEELIHNDVKNIILSCCVPFVPRETLTSICKQIREVGGQIVLAEIADAFDASTASTFLRTIGENRLMVYRSIKEALKAMRSDAG